MPRLAGSVILVFLAFLSLQTSQAADPRPLAEEHRDLVIITGADRGDAPAIEELGIIINEVDQDVIRAEATAAQQKTLAALGYHISIITRNIDEVYRRNSQTFSSDAWYMPYTDYRDTMVVIAQNNSSFIKLETLGYSFSNRQLLAMKFSDNPQQNESEPQVHFEANIHGDEKITWAVLMEMVKYLASNYGTDTLVTRLINEREIWLLPLVNPDGYERSRRYSDNNVDLNRNWGWMWQTGSGRGASPMSEPESQAQLGHILRHPFVTYVSYHSGTEFISHPWSYCYSSANTIPELPLIQFLSARYDYYSHYTYGQGADSMYTINGSTKDFNYGYDGSMGWSIEVHYTKTPPASEIIPTFNENRGAILEFCHHAGKGIHGTVTDAMTDAPVPAQVWVSPANWHSYTDPELGDFHRFYLPGTYNLTFRSPGYHDTTIAGVVVPNTGDSAVSVNVRLVPDPAAPLFGYRVMYCLYINSPSSNRTYPVRTLGPHDGTAYQLDAGKYLCIDMGKPVHNQTGVDLTVYRSSGSGSATVKGSHYWTGPWTTIGTANSPEASFDLTSASMDSVRYLRIEASSTFNLDAIEGVNYTGAAEEPERIAWPRPELRLRQNPTVGAVRFCLSRRPDQSLAVLLHDATGRLVRTLHPQSAEFSWDRRDGQGRTLPEGVFFARVNHPDARPVRVVLAR